MFSALFADTAWHYPLYLDGGEPARKRVEICVANNSDKDLEERVLHIPAKKLGLVGHKRNSLRIVSQRGTELLFSVAPYSETISENAVVTIPFDCPKKEKISLYAYFDNPKAAEVPDFYLYGLANEDFEQPKQETFRRWGDGATRPHDPLELSAEEARTGGQSAYVKVGENGENWSAFRRIMQVNEGAEYLFEGYVKVKNLSKAKPSNNIGFHFLAYSDSEKRFLTLTPHVNPMQKKAVYFNSPTVKDNCDWTKLSAKIKIPQGYNRLVVKTKSWCEKADVYFDDLSFAEVSPSPDFSYEVKPVESLSISSPQSGEKWEVSRSKYNTRLTASFFNLSDARIENAIGSIPIKRVAQGNFPTSDFKVYKDGKPVVFGVLGENMIFNIDEIPPKSESKYNIYLKTDRQNQRVKTSGAKQASYIPSDQIAEVRNRLDPKDFQKLFSKCANLLANPDFEDGDAAWNYRSKSRQAVSFADSGIFGGKAMRLKIDKTAPTYPGLEQSVKIKPDTNYIAIIWGKSNMPNSSVRSPLLKITDNKTGKSIRSEPKLVSNGEWEVQSTILANPYRDANAALLILNSTPVDFLFDGAVLCESLTAQKFESAVPMDFRKGQSTKLWQVNSIVKVFDFFAPPPQIPEAEISLAKNETENLQLAARSNENIENLSISAPAPKLKDNPDGNLSAPEIGVVGYVANDSVSNYLLFTHLKFYERCIPPQSRLEYYPDPIIPAKSISLAKGRTDSIFLTFKADEKTKSGVYEGAVELKSGDKTVASIPYRVTVRDFALPKASSLGAMFSYHGGASFGRWRGASIEPAMRNRFYNREDIQKFMAQKRATIDSPNRIKYRESPDGKLTPDFTDFDRFCELALEEHKTPYLYIPLPIQMLNWARPLNKVKSGGKTISPIEGEWPYKGKDLSKISDEFAEYTQTRVKLVFDHLRKKGWADRFIYFVSDEPYYWRAPIAAMLNRYCNIIRQAAPEIKIYSSTWGYTDTLKNAVDAWGLNMSAANTPNEIAELNAQKNKLKIFTTDGNYCIDTPYNAQERIMSIYCYAGGFAAYEYWGVLWNTQNPFKWAMHKDRISDSDPTNVRRNRYPNGDGYFAYDAEFIGKKEIYSSVRLEAVRDGQEDFEYYKLLENLAQKRNDSEAFKLLEDVKSLAVYPNAGGRNSAELLPNPDVVQILRDKVAQAIERLQKTN